MPDTLTAPTTAPARHTPHRYRFTVEEYHAMAEAGILHEDDRVELIEGQIMLMFPIGSRHADCVRRLIRMLVLRADSDAVVDAQNPIRLNDGTEPQPDLALLRPRDDYAEHLPHPEDVFLLIEVADTTLGYDRDVKVPLYAESGILEVWLIALEKDYVEVYREPSADGYGRMKRHRRGDTLTVEALSEVTFSVDEVLG